MIYYVGWSTGGGSHSRCFSTQEEREQFIRVHLSPKYNISTWQKEG